MPLETNTKLRGDNVLTVTVREHDYSAGCTRASTFGVPLILPLCSHVAVDEQIQVSIRANDIALSLNYIHGISIQNQIKGRICTLIPNGNSLIVQVDCGETLLVEITLGACRDMALQEGDTIYCLIKTHSITHLNEQNTQPYQLPVAERVNYGYRLDLTN
ncbi:MAG: TOBE domain-containing protein [Methylococcales bacterium]|nr:TOBE domain-containing protein [Methylococcales bacterium]MDD5754243.1 TOBE domain-containing protein [Methylococcales bacterium]